MAWTVKLEVASNFYVPSFQQSGFVDLFCMCLIAVFVLL